MRKTRPHLFSLIVLPVLLALALFAGTLERHGAARTGAAPAPEANAEPPAAQGTTGASRRPDGPNFVVIMVDDQSLNTFNRRVMPRTFARLVDRGTLFRNGLATPPLCCPARAAFLTGAYPHNNGVLSNAYGLWRDKDEHIGRWLRGGGYETGFVGKYLNKYELSPGTEDGYAPAPGWTYWWATPVRPTYYDYEVSFWDPRRSLSRQTLRFGSDREDYLTTRTTEAALDFIDTRASEPFFLWVSYYAPHVSRSEHRQCDRGAPTPLVADAYAYTARRGISFRRPPSYDESDVRDKPAEVRALPRIGGPEAARIRRSLHCSAAALREVDLGIEAIADKLAEEGIEQRTVLVYLSDNGTYFGEHRRPRGKILPYDAAVRVPYAIRLPAALGRGARVPVVRDIVGTIDLAPTIMQLAGERAPVRMDGRSLTPLLRGRRPGWSRERQLLLEIGRRCRGYRSVRERGWQYTIWLRRSPGAGCRIAYRELYDLRRDPHQLRNLLASAAAPGPRTRRVRARLAAALERLRICSGVPGREERLRRLPYCERERRDSRSGS